MSLPHAPAEGAREVALAAFLRLTIAGLLTVAACAPGGAPPTASVAQPRVIRIELLDFRFEPPVIDVRLGESVRLLAFNRSDLPHELFIGSAAEQEEHHQLHAAAAPDEQDDLDGVNGVYVPAWGSAQFTYRFERARDVIMGCHLVGHFEAGMVGVIHVSAER